GEMATGARADPGRERDLRRRPAIAAAQRYRRRGGARGRGGRRLRRAGGRLRGRRRGDRGRGRRLRRRGGRNRGRGRGHRRRGGRLRGRRRGDRRRGRHAPARVVVARAGTDAHAALRGALLLGALPAIDVVGVVVLGEAAPDELG